MVLRPAKVHEGAVGRCHGINDLRRVFNGAVVKSKTGQHS